MGPGVAPPGLPQIRTCPTKAYGSSSHGFTPRYAIRCRPINRVLRLGVPALLPDRGSVTRPPFPPPGPPMASSPTSPVLWRTPTPAIPSHRTLVLARRYPRASGLSLLPRPDADEAGPEFLVRYSSDRPSERGRAAGLSGSWGTLVCVRPVLGPRQDRYTRPSTVYRRGPSARSDGGLAARGLISGLDRTAFTRVVYASPAKSPGPTQDSLLAAGQALPGGIGHPQGSDERFPSCTRYISSPFPKLSGRKNEPAHVPSGPMS